MVRDGVDFVHSYEKFRTTSTFINFTLLTAYAQICSAHISWIKSLDSPLLLPGVWIIEMATYRVSPLSSVCGFVLVFLSFTLQFTHQPSLTTWLSVCSSIHFQTSFHFCLSLQTGCFLFTRLFIALHHKLSALCSFSFFIVTFPCHLLSSLPFSPCLFFFFSSPFATNSPSSQLSPFHPPLSYLAVVSAADVARPQTSASHVPLQLNSADQTNRFNSLKLAAPAAAVQLGSLRTITV